MRSVGWGRERRKRERERREKRGEEEKRRKVGHSYFQVLKAHANRDLLLWHTPPSLR